MLLHCRPKLTDFYILSRTKLLENHPLHRGKYPHILYIEVPLAILIVIHLFKTKKAIILKYNYFKNLLLLLSVQLLPKHILVLASYSSHTLILIFKNYIYNKLLHNIILHPTP